MIGVPTQLPGGAASFDPTSTARLGSRSRFPAAAGATQFHLDLWLVGTRLELRLAGPLRADSARRLSAVLSALNFFATTVYIRAGQVDIAEVEGVRPLFEAIRSREAGNRPALRVIEFSPALRTLLAALQVPCTGRLDLDAWDRATAGQEGSRGRRRRHLRLLASPEATGTTGTRPSQVDQ